MSNMYYIKLYLGMPRFSSRIKKIPLCLFKKTWGIYLNKAGFLSQLPCNWLRKATAFAEAHFSEKTHKQSIFMELAIRSLVWHGFCVY